MICGDYQRTKTKREEANEEIENLKLRAFPPKKKTKQLLFKKKRITIRQRHTANTRRGSGFLLPRISLELHRRLVEARTSRPQFVGGELFVGLARAARETNTRKDNCCATPFVNRILLHHLGTDVIRAAQEKGKSENAVEARRFIDLVLHRGVCTGEHTREAEAHVQAKIGWSKTIKDTCYPRSRHFSRGFFF